MKHGRETFVGEEPVRLEITEKAMVSILQINTSCLLAITLHHNQQLPLVISRLCGAKTQLAASTERTGNPKLATPSPVISYKSSVQNFP